MRKDQKKSRAYVCAVCVQAAWVTSALLLAGAHVDHEAVAHVFCHEPVVRLVHVVNGDGLDLAGDLLEGEPAKESAGGGREVPVGA